MRIYQLKSQQETLQVHMLRGTELNMISKNSNFYYTYVIRYVVRTNFSLSPPSSLESTRTYVCIIYHTRGSNRATPSIMFLYGRCRCWYDKKDLPFPDCWSRMDGRSHATEIPGISSSFDKSQDSNRSQQPYLLVPARPSARPHPLCSWCLLFY